MRKVIIITISILSVLLSGCVKADTPMTGVVEELLRDYYDQKKYDYEESLSRIKSVNGEWMLGEILYESDPPGGNDNYKGKVAGNIILISSLTEVVFDGILYEPYSIELLQAEEIWRRYRIQQQGTNALGDGVIFIGFLVKGTDEQAQFSIMIRKDGTPYFRAGEPFPHWGVYPLSKVE